jgi:hypothetical protein
MVRLIERIHVPFDEDREADARWVGASQVFLTEGAYWTNSPFPTRRQITEAN